MNLRSLINFKDALNTGVGVNIYATDEGLRISCCVIKKQQDTLIIVERMDSLDTIKLLDQAIRVYGKAGARIHVNFSGKGVLIKATEKANSRDDTTIQKLFPFIRGEEMTRQWFDGTSSAFITVARKELLKVIEPLILQGYHIVSYSLGPFILESIATLADQSSISVDGYTIELAGGIQSVSISDQDFPKSSIMIGAESLESSLLLAYASACNLFITTHEVVVTPVPWIENARDSFSTINHLFKLSKRAVIVTLTILFLNILAFFWLQERNSELESQVTSASGRSEEEKNQEMKVASLLKGYDALGWQFNQIPLYYADQLATNLPAGIQFTTVEVGVLDEVRARQERTQVFQPDLIKINGLAVDPVSLQEWVTVLQKTSWIDHISDQQYRYDVQRGKGVFQLQIYCK